VCGAVIVIDDLQMVLLHLDEPLGMMTMMNLKDCHHRYCY
jgi:hypothetical protein